MPLALGPLQSQFTFTETSWPSTWARVRETMPGLRELRVQATLLEQLYVARATVEEVLWLLAPLAELKVDGEFTVEFWGTMLDEVKAGVQGVADGWERFAFQWREDTKWETKIRRDWETIFGV